MDKIKKCRLFWSTFLVKLNVNNTYIKDNKLSILNSKITLSFSWKEGEKREKHNQLKKVEKIAIILMQKGRS